MQMWLKTVFPINMNMTSKKYSVLLSVDFLREKIIPAMWCSGCPCCRSASPIHPVPVDLCSKYAMPSLPIQFNLCGIHFNTVLNSTLASTKTFTILQDKQT